MMGNILIHSALVTRVVVTKVELQAERCERLSVANIQRHQGSNRNGAPGFCRFG